MESEELDWWREALERAVRVLAHDLRMTVALDYEGAFNHALALFKDFRNAVEALVLLRSGWIVPLRR